MAGSCGWRGSSSGGLRELLSLCWSVTVEQVVVPKETQANSCTAWLCDCSLCWFIWMPFSCHMIHQSQDASLCALCVSVVSLNYFNLHRVLTYCILKCWRFFFFPLQCSTCMHTPGTFHSASRDLQVQFKHKFYLSVLRKLCESKYSFQYVLHKCDCLL